MVQKWWKAEEVAKGRRFYAVVRQNEGMKGADIAKLMGLNVGVVYKYLKDYKYIYLRRQKAFPNTRGIRQVVKTDVYDDFVKEYEDAFNTSQQ